jgi:hypothetical protein
MEGNRGARCVASVLPRRVSNIKRLHDLARTHNMVVCPARALMVALRLGWTLKALLGD